MRVTRKNIMVKKEKKRHDTKISKYKIIMNDHKYSDREKEVIEGYKHGIKVDDKDKKYQKEEVLVRENANWVRKPNDFF